MPAYHVDIAAVTASSDRKWVDNLLARFELPGVDRSRQGVARRISAIGMRHIVLTRWLSKELGVPIARAVKLAVNALASPDGVVDVGPGVELRIDRSRLAAQIDELTADAVEWVVPARRGRPPRQGLRDR